MNTGEKEREGERERESQTSASEENWYALSSHSFP